MEDDKPAIPTLAPPLPSKSVQRRLTAQPPRPAPPASPDPRIMTGPTQPVPQTRIYRVIETCDIPMGAARATLKEGEELSSRQYDIPHLVAMGARLQEVV